MLTSLAFSTLISTKQDELYTEHVNNFVLNYMENGYYYKNTKRK